MRLTVRFAPWAAAVALLTISVPIVAAQTGASGVPYPVMLVTPVYPPIAVSAHIAGEVVIVVTVRADGSVVGEAVTSGPPLLADAARRAAKASTFECPGCASEQQHTISYTFGFDLPAEEVQIDATASRLQISSPGPIVEPLFANVLVRSPKCLYLWHCASQWMGRDYYNYRVRSGWCGWLWKCGWRRRTKGAG